MVLFWSVDFSLIIQKSSLHFDNDRDIYVYFPPVILDDKNACLRINFTAFSYFAVKIAYFNDSSNEYKERVLFRSMESLGKEFLQWQATITPDMTDGGEFAVVLHARGSAFGKMAVINGIHLQMAECHPAGKKHEG